MSMGLVAAVLHGTDADRSTGPQSWDPEPTPGSGRVAVASAAVPWAPAPRTCLSCRGGRWGAPRLPGASFRQKPVWPSPGGGVQFLENRCGGAVGWDSPRRTTAPQRSPCAGLQVPTAATQ